MKAKQSNKADCNISLLLSGCAGESRRLKFPLRCLRGFVCSEARLLCFFILFYFDFAPT